MILNMKTLNGIVSIVNQISFMLAVMKLDFHCLDHVRLTVIVLLVRLFALCLAGVKYQQGMEEDQKLRMNAKN